MFELIITFIESRWKPFAVVFAFFLVGFADAKCVLLYCSDDLRQKTLWLIVLMNAATIAYIGWLCARPSFYIQPRARAIAFALSASILGAASAALTK